MEEQDDKEAILILTQLRDEHFWGNEEWNVASILHVYVFVCQ